jgi:hypothetical protein
LFLRQFTCASAGEQKNFDNAIVKLLAERELSLSVESEFLGVLQMGTFWMF